MTVLYTYIQAVLIYSMRKHDRLHLRDRPAGRRVHKLASSIREIGATMFNLLIELTRASRVRRATGTGNADAAEDLQPNRR